MNSFNHYAFGSVGEWLYRYVAGIDLDADIPGFRRFRIRPFPGGGLTHARAEYDSIQGQIVSAWSLEGGSMNLEVTIPANTRAEIFIPCPEKNRIQEGGRPWPRAEGVRFLRTERDRTVLEVGSGTYLFSFPAPTSGFSR
jgi:alpha-L-rhamnosidase